MNQNNQYVVPRVAINETPPAPNPGAGVSVGTIGLVGTFSKGPLNTPTVCYGLGDVIRKFGGYTAGLTGYLSAQGAFNQGTDKIVIVRVAAAAVATARLDLMDNDEVPAPSVTVRALTPGTDGNNISVMVEAGTAAGSFKLTVSYKRVPVEIFDNLTLVTLGEIVSEYVAVEAAELSDEIPAPLADTPLAGGNDGAVTADTDYIGAIDVQGNRSGLKTLEVANVNIIVCAQQTSAAIRSAMVEHCKAASVAKGLRIAVLNSVKGLTEGQASAAQTLSEARAIVAYPWVTPLEQPNILAAPDGYYAGVLATIPSHVSPSNCQVKGILALERPLIVDPEDDGLIALTRARISPIARDNATNDFRIANGVTTFDYVPNTGTDDWSQTSIRRVYDEIEMIIWQSTYWAKSKPINKQLLGNLRDQIDEILRVKRDAGVIYDFKPTVCDEKNNTPEMMAQRRVVTAISIRPSYAADFIDHNIGRHIA